MSDWYKCKGDCLGGGYTCTWVGEGCTPVCGASQGVGNMPWPHLTMIINVCTCMQVWHVVCMYSAVEGRVRSLFFGNCYHDGSSYVILVADGPCTTRICIPHTYCGLVYATLPTKSSHNKAITSKLVTCYPARMHRGKIIGLSVHLSVCPSVVTMKIARSRHLGTWATRKRDQSVGISDKLAWMCFKSLGTVHERHKWRLFVGHRSHAYRPYPLLGWLRSSTLQVYLCRNLQILAKRAQGMCSREL